MQEVKNFLSWYKHIDVLLDSLNEQYKDAEWYKMNTSSAKVKAAIDESMKSIKEYYTQKQALKKQIKDVIGAVSDEKLRIFLVLRYLECKPMERIAEEIGRCEVHIRRNIEKKALKAVSELLRISDADKKDIDSRASTSPERDKEEYNPNPITETTKKCVCWWFSEGDSLESISELLCRPIEVIENILNTCRQDGSYDNYVSIKRYGNKKSASRVL